MDNKFISLYLDNEVSKIRVALLQENQILRLELEALKAANASLLADVAGKIENSGDKITEKAIDKTLAIIQQVKIWFGIAAVLITAVFGFGALLGYKNLSDTLTASFKDEVKHWMRFDEEKSGGKKALDELRTEAIINAYMIRLARSYSSARLPLFQLNGQEEKRLLDILQTPATRYSDFADALTIITKNRGPLRFASSEDEVAQKIVSLLGAEGISPEKKGLVLERLKGEEALLPYAKMFLNDENQHINVRMTAFENVKSFNPEMARDFAEKNVEKVKPHFRGDLVLYLAEESGTYAQALRYVRELIELKPDGWQSRVLGVVSSLGETLPPVVDPGAYKLADFFLQVINLGGGIGFSDPRFGHKRIVLQIDGAYSMLKKPGLLLNDSALIDAIITKGGTSVDWLTKATESLQLSDQGVLLTTLIVKPGEKSSFQTQGKSILTNKNVLGEIWLRTQNFPGGKQLMATWRDNQTGIVHTDSIEQVDQIDNMEFKLSFDPKLLESLSYVEYSSMDSL